ncbi:MAG: tyrosine-type recombinase/integrase [Planctomycetes bacterium]|nr:tyrosine-type recombinase/integrase [Planctomycetota bacterium]
MIAIAASRGRLYQRERIGSGPIWTLDYRDDAGKRRRIVLGSDKRAAEKRAAEILRKRDLSTGRSTGVGVDLLDLAQLYIDDLKTRAVPRHVEQVQDRLHRIFRELGAKQVGDLTPLAMTKLRSKRLAEGVSNRTANLDLDVVRAMLTWAVSIDLLEANPLRKLKRLPESEATQRVRRRALSEAEIARFLAAAEADDEHQANRLAAEATIAARTQGAAYALVARPVRVPQAPLWRGFLATGARFGELTRVTWADLDIERAVLRLRAETTKAGKQRLIPLHESYVRQLTELRAVHERVRGRPVEPGDRVFLTPDGADVSRYSNNLMRLFERLLVRSGIPKLDAHGRKVDVHALRHTVASRCARNGISLIQAQRLLGHSDPKLTARTYSHLEVEDLRGAVERLHAS